MLGTTEPSKLANLVEQQKFLGTTSDLLEQTGSYRYYLISDNEVIDNLSFIQQLNYKFNYAKQKSDSSITYVQSTTLTDVHQDLKTYVFKMSSLIHVSTRLVKIIIFLLDKNARLGNILRHREESTKSVAMILPTGTVSGHFYSFIKSKNMIILTKRVET